MTYHLCISFLNSASWTWQKIEQTQHLGFPFGEETITEMLLTSLWSEHSNQIKIHPFKKHQERLNGADWEWFIGREGSWIGMRVQAKRIKLPREQYESLFYKYNKAGAETQIGNLIEKAIQADLTPVYCLYTFSTQRINGSTCRGNCVFFDDVPQQVNGCLISHADDILFKGSRKLSEITPISFPWHCLVCPCSKANNPDEPDNPANGIFKRLRESGRSLRDEPGFNPDAKRFVAEPRPNLPEHMQILKDGSKEGDKYLQRYAKKWDLGGLMLIDTGGRH